MLPTGIQVGMGVKPAAVQKIFIQGDYNHTGNELDLTIQGKGFFQILMPDGTISYTRSGTLKIDSEGNIVTSDGLPLEPALTIPTDTKSITIDTLGQVSVMQPGSVDANVLGTLELASFVNPAGLSSIGSNLYQQTSGSGEPIVGTPGEEDLGSVLQGYLEMSNVSVVEELTKMIQAQRAYEMNSKSIQAADDMLQAANQLKR